MNPSDSCEPHKYY